MVVDKIKLIIKFALLNIILFLLINIIRLFIISNTINEYLNLFIFFILYIFVSSYLNYTFLKKEKYNASRYNLHLSKTLVDLILSIAGTLVVLTLLLSFNSSVWNDNFQQFTSSLLIYMLPIKLALDLKLKINRGD